jgi:murein DD-endopeptidase MepM/ murein hydrolase activator NlpD
MRGRDESLVGERHVSNVVRRALGILCICLFAAVPAAADDLTGKKAALDRQIGALRDKVMATHQRESALRAQVASLDGQIRSLALRNASVGSQLTLLERDLALQRRRAAKVNALYDLQTRRLRLLVREQAATRRRLADRLVAIYETDHVESVQVFLDASSFTELLDRAEYMNRIATQDKRIAADVAASRQKVAEGRTATGRVRARVSALAQAIAARADQVRLLRDELAARQSEIASARADKKQSLDSLSESERAAADEIDALEQQSANLAARIRAASADSGAASAGSGAAPRSSPGGAFSWPVAGTVTSPFGARWGRMHEGIDIAASSGRPIAAAGAGRVIYAGWMSGYGNLVVIDHGGGIATAYAHQSAIASAVGQTVERGQTIGYVGSTGNSTGPHLHFEVRSAGSPVDPFGYL